MKKILLAAAALSLFTFYLTPLTSQAQSDPVVIEVGGQQIRKSEFMKEFNANVGQQLNKKSGITDAEKRAALDEYVDLYSIFRAKILDAHVRGFDTATALKRELGRYRKELAAPYLIDSTVLQRLLAEAYERNHHSLHAAHILVQVSPNATPEDTLKAYNKALALYHRVTDGGEDFMDVAADYAREVNPDAKVRPNEGDLGYFTVFDMVYPFESAAYALQVGEVCKPVRTRFGYHIIKLLDKVEMYGKVTMAHIWLHSRDSAARQKDIERIYSQLNQGISFASLAKESDDRTTSNKGGELTDASLSQLPPEYIHELVGLKEGEYSKPFFTQYGWHIIKLIKRDTLPQPEDLEGFYKQRMTRDQRGEASRKTFAANSRTRYGIVDCTATPVKQTSKGRKKDNAPVKMMASLDELFRLVPDTVRYGKWASIDESQFTDTTPLIIAPDRRYTTLDVARYVFVHQKRIHDVKTQVFLRQCYEEFLDSITIAYADSRLESEYPEFAQVVDEYRRGLMIFNYNDAMIWHKAIEDSVGFADFYARESRTKRLDNPDDSIYFFHPRARVTVINVSDANALAPEKAQKLIEKAAKKSASSSEMKQMLLKKAGKNAPNNLVSVDLELVEKTRQQLLTDDQWQQGVYLVNRGNGYRLLVVEEILPRSLKGIREARGYYLNAWQNEVERQLNEELRKNYNVKIHRDVVRTLTF